MKKPIQSERCLSVVIPSYNERDTLPLIVDKLLVLPQLLEIIIVDDCSNDGSDDIGRSLAEAHPQVQFTRHQKNSGKTEALKTGFKLTSGSIVIIQDADLEYDPEEIPQVIQPIIDGHADVVYGSRFLVRKASRVLYFYHFVANKFLTFLSNSLTNLNMTDVETGYKAFRGEIIRKMTIVSSGFGFEIEVTAKVAKLKCAVYETPISYYGRTYEEGKKIGMMDGVIAMWLILRFNLFCSLESSFSEPVDLKLQSAVSNQQSAVSNQQSAVSNQQSAVSNQQSAVSNQQSAVSNQQSAVSSQQSAVSNQQSAVSNQM